MDVSCFATKLFKCVKVNNQVYFLNTTFSWFNMFSTFP